MGIDINCDMGESYGAFKVGNDEEMMKWITSANIACGFHGGDPKTMRETVRLAKKYGVAIGAHPSLPDLVGFGRREMKVDPDTLYHDLIYQIGALKTMAEIEGLTLQHVKPHGALYNMAQRDATIAEAVVQAVYDVDPKLILFGIDGSQLLIQAEKRRLRTAREFFVDRTYTDDGSLTPRDEPNAHVNDLSVACERVIRLVREKQVITLTGKSIPMEADTVCIHGDGPHALQFAKGLYARLKESNISIHPVGTL
jgi:UPF0271 protein